MLTCTVCCNNFCVTYTSINVYEFSKHKKFAMTMPFNRNFQKRHY